MLNDYRIRRVAESSQDANQRNREQKGQRRSCILIIYSGTNIALLSTHKYKAIVEGNRRQPVVVSLGEGQKTVFFFPGRRPKRGRKKSRDFSDDGVCLLQIGACGKLFTHCPRHKNHKHCGMAVSTTRCRGIHTDSALGCGGCVFMASGRLHFSLALTSPHPHAQKRKCHAQPPISVSSGTHKNLNFGCKPRFQDRDSCRCSCSNVPSNVKKIASFFFLSIGIDVEKIRNAVQIKWAPLKMR